MYAKDTYKLKYQYLVKHEEVGLRHFKDLKAFIKYSNDMNSVYNSIEKHNPGKEQEVLIVFDNMIADMISNKKLHLAITELFIRGRKLNISLVLIIQSCVKRFKTKQDTFFYHEDSIKASNSTNCYRQFI